MDSAVTSTECRTPDGPVKLTVHVRSATARQRIIFALCSPREQLTLNLARDPVAHFILTPGDDVDRDLDPPWEDPAALHAPDRGSRKAGALAHLAESQKSERHA